MLIIPIQNKPDWRHPPIITIGLMLLNLLVFVFYQSGDEEIAERAADIYHENRLLPLEKGLYLDYLSETHPAAHDELQQWESEAGGSDYIFWSLFADREFDDYLQNYWPTATAQERHSTQVLQDWRAARLEFQAQRDELSAIEAGLIPAEAKLWTFVTSLFLHGSWDHLIGNMVFLFLFGFTLERVCKAHTYLGLYLLSGVAASALFVVFNLQSQTPLVGASGAVSGLMGMYLALYGLRKIRFFYTVFFYFGEFTAPALFILPLWLAKELYGHFHVDSNIAYWAHIGGLLAGASVMFFTSRPQTVLAAVEESQEQEDEVAQGLKRIQQKMTTLDYGPARLLAGHLRQTHPNDARVWKQAFDLEKLQPKTKQFHQMVFDLLKQFQSSAANFAEWRELADQVMAEYRQQHPQAPALTGNLCLALATKYWRNNDRPQADGLLKLAVSKDANKARHLQLLREMWQDYCRLQDHVQAQRLAATIERLSEPNTTPAQTLPPAE